ncbi:MAG: OmpA family protein [candidate division WOR-3 bacterium]|nr:MAG: OmpA family protein [candidate division WOR-3 bacterium]
MRYVRLGIPIFLALLVLIGCPRRQVVQPTEEVVVEEVPEEVIIEEPAKPPFMVQRIFFDFDKSDIRADAAEILKKNAQMLELYPEVTIIIEGHCCEIGTAEYNLALGERRAKAAQDYLLMLGVTPARFSTISYGEERPLDPEILERNRRCEFRSN